MQCPKCRRSYPQHARYFGIIRAAFDHWPENHVFKPDNETHLRKWLQAKAGYRTVTEIEVGNVGARELQLAKTAVAAAMSLSKDYAWIWPTERGLSVMASKSIDFASLKASEAGKLFDAVDSQIEIETGTRGSEYLRQTENAA